MAQSFPQNTGAPKELATVGRMVGPAAEAGRQDWDVGYSQSQQIANQLGGLQNTVDTSKSVIALNGLQGEVTLGGLNGIGVEVSGQTIYLDLAQGTTAPGVTPGTDAVSVSVTGNEYAGQLTVNCLAIGVIGTLVIVAYPAAHVAPAKAVILTAANSVAALTPVYVSASDASGFTVSTASATVASAVLHINYFVVG